MARKFTITAVGNEKTKTFDIIKLWNDGVGTIFRTNELSPEEYEDMEYNTMGDWINFLNNSLSYYVISAIEV